MNRSHNVLKIRINPIRRPRSVFGVVRRYLHNLSYQIVYLDVRFIVAKTNASNVLVLASLQVHVQFDKLILKLATGHGKEHPAEA